VDLLQSDLQFFQVKSSLLLDDLDLSQNEGAVRTTKQSMINQASKHLSVDSQDASAGPVENSTQFPKLPPKLRRNILKLGCFEIGNFGSQRRK
jgi:hypothetical protein